MLFLSVTEFFGFSPINLKKRTGLSSAREVTLRAPLPKLADDAAQAVVAAIDAVSVLCVSHCSIRKLRYVAGHRTGHRS